MSRPLVVLKFGGTSVADPQKIQRAAARAITLRRRGRRVVVVVSAPGDMTDELLDLAGQVSRAPDARELDALLATGEQLSIALFAMACKAQGADAVSLTGPQAGIEADARHNRSQIVAIRPEKILSELSRGRIVAVAGFQGLNPNADVTTLGRGGSDLSAVALAAALKATHCDIYTDVKGVYTADPRLVPEARKLGALSYEEMLELSGAGAQVMQARSIELAQRFGVKIHVRSSFHAGEGTWIVARKENAMEQASVSSLALDKGEVRISIVEVPDKPGVAATVLAALAERDIPVDMVVQSAPTQRGVNDISFMIPRAGAQAARLVLGSLVRKLGAKRVDVHEQVAKITAVGTGFRRRPDVVAAVFRALARQKINIQMISSSDLKVSCVVDQRRAEAALKALHHALRLSR